MPAMFAFCFNNSSYIFCREKHFPWADALRTISKLTVGDIRTRLFCNTLYSFFHIPFCFHLRYQTYKQSLIFYDLYIREVHRFAILKLILNSKSSCTPMYNLQRCTIYKSKFCTRQILSKNLQC